MNMHLLDWGILSGLSLFLIFYTVRTKKYSKSVAGFLAADRCAGKYLLGVADGIAALGAISIVAQFELYSKAGFTSVWWQSMLLPLWTIMTMFGWVQYRYRQTRVLTMAQFLEIRYSHRFRIFAGIVAFISGILNFGLFPAVGGRFFQYYCGFPPKIVSLGFVEVDLTYALIMAILLSISLFFTLAGGQITIMVTDFLQGAFVNIAFVVIAFYLLFVYFDWSQIIEATAKAPPDASLINPFKTSQVDNFNVWYYFVLIFSGVINFMAWQGQQGYFVSAKSPHEARMGRIVGMFRWFNQTLPIILFALGAYTVLNHSDFSSLGGSINETLEKITNPQLRSQLTVTMVITNILPVGLIGLFAGVMFAAFISTHSTYLHSWGSMFIQDVVLPIRQSRSCVSKPIEQKSHIFYLRMSIIGTCIFIFLFSLLFQQNQDIFMYFALAGSLFLGWAGWTIIGGLYWKHGNAYGAWAGSIVGITLSLFSWFLFYFWPSLRNALNDMFPYFWQWLVSFEPELQADKFPFSAQILFFWTMVASGLAYVLTSIISGRGRAFNMDKMLHRGEYSDGTCDEKPKGWAVFKMGKQFSFDDKILFVSSYVYMFLFFGVVLLGTLWVVVLRQDISDDFWAKFWYGFCIFAFVLSFVSSVWFLIGGIKDYKELIKKIKTIIPDKDDDGTVVDNENLTDKKESRL